MKPELLTDEQVTSKHCRRCNSTKPASEFSKRSRVKDGLQSCCKSCMSNIYMEKHSEIRERQQSAWSRYSEENRDKLIAKNKQYRARNKDALSAKKKLYFEHNPKKLAAKNSIHSHVLTGRIQRMPCEICGEEKAEGHHDDYDKPLEVRWLCKKHHARWHVENGEGKNAHT